MSEFIGKMPIRKDIEVLPEDEPKQLKAGIPIAISNLMATNIGGSLRWICSTCNEEKETTWDKFFKGNSKDHKCDSECINKENK